MNLNKISNFIKEKRKELGLTQEQLANQLFVTEKAISRWETGRGTPDISLLIPLSEVLNIDVSELLNGESKSDIVNLIHYQEENKKNKFNLYFKIILLFFTLSLLSFLIYLRFEYDPRIEIHYFIRLLMVIVASTFAYIGNHIYSNYYVEKIEDKKKVTKFSQSIIFIYYIIFLFNVVIFARYNEINSYNLIPFKTIIDFISNGSIYSIIINIFGNLLVFMPLEYFMIELFHVKKWWKNFTISFTIILLIEIFQYVFKVGVLDIDDLILSIFGMIIFYYIYIKYKKV